MQYKFNTETTLKVCNYLGWMYAMKAIKTMVKGNIIYVRGTLLKPDEVNDLQSIDGAEIEGKKCKLMNFNT